MGKLLINAVVLYRLNACKDYLFVFFANCKRTVCSANEILCEVTQYIMI